MPISPSDDIPLPLTIAAFLEEKKTSLLISSDKT
jgi:hypothetical protein